MKLIVPFKQVLIALELGFLCSCAVNASDNVSQTVAPWVGRAVQVGAADESQRIVITAYLAWRNQQELERLIQDQTTPGNPRYEQFLTPEQFHAAFSPKVEDVAAVQDALAKFGFKIENVPASGLFVQASGTVSQAKQAFRVSQNLYSYQGKILRSHAEEPSLPPSISGLVTYIAGLDDSRFLIRPAHVQVPRIAGSPIASADLNLFPCSTYWGEHRFELTMPSPFPYGSYLPSYLCGYTPQQIRAAYGADRIHQTGRGVRVAIADLNASPTIVADVNRYSANHGLPPLTYDNFVQIVPPGVNNVPTGAPCGPLSEWFGEETLDITAVHSMAPDAFIFYVGGACDAADEPDGGVAVEPIYEIIDNRLADIVSNSWLWNGEADVPPGRLKTDNDEFMQAAAQGMSVLFATGDDGDLTRQGFAFGGPNAIASGSWPADSPYVTAVGGTSLLLKDSSGGKSEFGWAMYQSIFTSVPVLNSAGTVVTDQGWGPFGWAWGSGGGPSLIMLQPWYQKEVVPRIFATQTYLSGGVPVPLDPPRRVTPDIAMLADVETGFLVGQRYTIYTPPVDPGCVALSKRRNTANTSLEERAWRHLYLPAFWRSRMKSVCQTARVLPVS
jgi:subtilase family serine protease